MLKFTYTLILFFLIIQSGISQNILSGSITSKRKPVAFASVNLKQSNKSTLTDSLGNFSFSGLPTGNYTLEIHCLGFFSNSVQINFPEQSTVQIELMQNSDQLDQVVVTGTMKPVYLKESPVKVEVISTQKLNSFLPSAGATLMDNITLLPGVQEVTACGVCFTNSISINGLPGPYTAVLMDGSPIYGNLAAVYGLNGIPNMMIDQFEVIKGPNSTLYGSEAVAGVINIITKDPETQPLLSVDLMGTSHLESFGNIALAPKIGKSSGFLGVNYAYINDFDDDNEDGFGDMANMDRISVFSKWNIHRPSGKQFTLAAKYYYEDRRNGVKEFLSNRNYQSIRGNDSIYGESIYTNRAELFGTYVFSPFNIKLDFSTSYHVQDSYYGSDGYFAEQAIGFLNATKQIQAGKHDLIIGLSQRINQYDDNTVATEDQFGKNKEDLQYIPGVFVQDNLKVSEVFSVLGGLRLDHYTSHGFILSPRLSTKHNFSKWTTLRTNFGTGFRVVNLFTEDHAFITGQRTVEITEALKPEESYNGSVSLNHIYQGFGGSGSIDIEGYYTYFKNKIYPDYSDPSKIIYENSNGYAQTMGVGASVSQSFRIPLAFNLSGNLQLATETEENDEGALETRRIEFAPNWTGVFTMNYQFRKHNLEIAYTARATGRMALPEVYDIDPSTGELKTEPRSTISTPFSIHNIQLNKQFKSNFSMYAGVQNIFNYQQPVSPLTGFNDPNNPTGFSPFFDTAYNFGPLHGRELYIGVKWNFN